MLPKSLLEDNLELMIPTIVELVNLSLSQGSMESLKTADVIPSIKGESLDHNTLKNFRPVSNLQFIGKLVEKVVLRRLNDHMKLNNLNVPEQSAYKKDHSTETLLVRVTNDILISSDSKSATVVLLLDLSAAFDTVDHKLLLNILETEIGLKGIVLKWFRSFLTSGGGGGGCHCPFCLCPFFFFLSSGLDFGTKRTKRTPQLTHQNKIMKRFRLKRFRSACC